jgi:hypothetical protein
MNTQYRNKYLKYKTKYLELCSLIKQMKLNGGNPENGEEPVSKRQRTVIQEKPFEDDDKYENINDNIYEDLVNGKNRVEMNLDNKTKINLEYIDWYSYYDNLFNLLRAFGVHI